MLPRRLCGGGSFLSSLGYPVDNATRILSDNQGSISLSKNPEGHRKVKHMAFCHHFIRDKVADGTLILNNISTPQMAADVLTKAVSAIQRHTTTTVLGMTSTAAPA